MQKKVWAVGFLLVSTVVLFTLAAGRVAFAFSAAQDIDIVNNTGTDLYGLFISSAATKSWEENLLEGDTLASGETISISFEGYDSDECLWDIQVKDEDDAALTWKGLDLCEASKIILNYDGKEGWVDLE